MADASKYLFNYLLILVLLFMVPISSQARVTKDRIKTEVFLSPKIELEPGQASNKVYPNIDFPKGHIAIKSFDAELVDEKGRPVPLHDTYVHHWVVIRYYQDMKNESNLIPVTISGVCNAESGLTQYFGLGAETRGTRTDIPDPYGVVVGNPADAPEGYQERWLLNVHAIDTRDARNRMGCLECACHLYSNITGGTTLPGNYSGGLRCCTDESRCEVKEGSRNGKQTLYLRYKIKYVDWDASIKPARVYILDVTDEWTKGDLSKGIQARHNCQIEYDVPACRHNLGSRDGCVHSRTLKFAFPAGGDVIYAVGHLHVGGKAIALYGEGGKEICTSYAKYGKGKAAGNEAGYVVGMSTCYPSPGSIKIATGEMVTLVSNYSNTRRHTGVMGYFYLLVADSTV